MDRKGVEVMWSNLINLVLVLLAVIFIFLPLGMSIYGLFFNNPNERIEQNFDRLVLEMQEAAYYLHETKDPDPVEMRIPLQTGEYDLQYVFQVGRVQECHRDPCICVVKKGTSEPDTCSAFKGDTSISLRHARDFNENRDPKDIYYIDLRADKRPDDVHLVLEFPR